MSIDVHHFQLLKDLAAIKSPGPLHHVRQPVLFHVGPGPLDDHREVHTLLPLPRRRLAAAPQVQRPVQRRRHRAVPEVLRQVLSTCSIDINIQMI